MNQPNVITADDRKGAGIIIISLFVTFLATNIFFQLWYLLNSASFLTYTAVHIITDLTCLIAVITALRHKHLFTNSIGYVAAILLCVQYGAYILLNASIYLGINNYIGHFLGDYYTLIINIINIILFSTFIFSIKCGIAVKLIWCLNALLLLASAAIYTKNAIAFTEYNATDSYSYYYLSDKLMTLALYVRYALIATNFATIIAAVLWMTHQKTSAKMSATKQS